MSDEQSIQPDSADNNSTENQIEDAAASVSESTNQETPTEAQTPPPEPAETASPAAPAATSKIQIGSQRAGHDVTEAPKPTDTLGTPVAQAIIEERKTSSFPPPRVERISKELQDEIDAAIGDLSMDELLGASTSSGSSSDSIELDSRIQAHVVKIHRDHVFFSLGANHEGTASLKQFDELPEIGTQMEVIPVKFIADEGLYEVVVPGGSMQVADWSDLVEGVVVEAMITGHNKGGLECEVNHIRGFMPAGQISLYRVDDFEQFVGEKMQCVVTEANESRRNLVLSHRAILEREKEAARAKTMAELEVGQVREGTITKIMDFGVFVDIGGVDGLIHISQLSWDRVNHPSEVVAEGDRAKVRIEKIDEATGKIGLSYRDMLVNPWDGIDTKYPIGAVVKGTVSKLMDFGAFVKLEPGVEGLVHISELAHHRVSRVNLIVSEGQEVDVKVLSVDSDAQKISLSMKAAQAAPEKPKPAEEEEDDEPARVVKTQDPSTLKGGLSRPTGGEQFGLKW
ncbi:MAG: S1 RNA-binding domain-containing protein [Planctomycetales bacterium]|nr:S1 RNA-binding domain-containing protein [Planctomycetales bacterium]